MDLNIKVASAYCEASSDPQEIYVEMTGVDAAEVAEYVEIDDYIFAKGTNDILAKMNADEVAGVLGFDDEIKELNDQIEKLKEELSEALNG